MRGAGPTGQSEVLSRSLDPRTERQPRPAFIQDPRSPGRGRSVPLYGGRVSRPFDLSRSAFRRATRPPAIAA